MCLQRAREAHDGSSQAESLEPVAQRALAERGGRALVFAQCAHDASPRTACEGFEYGQHREHQSADEREIDESERQWSIDERLKRPRYEIDAKRATGQMLGVAQNDLHENGKSEGRDGKIVGLEPQRRRAHEGGSGAGRGHRADPSGRDRPFVAAKTSFQGRRCQQGRSVCPYRHEAGDPDIEKPHLAPLQI